MTATTMTLIQRRPGGDIIGRFARAWTARLERLETWFRRRDTARQLSALGDDTLRDIGLERAAIGRTVSELEIRGGRYDARY